jgi:hypothetical protein
MEHEQASFNKPRPAQDQYTQILYDRLEVGNNPSLEELEPHVIEMLANGTALEAMSLIFSREVDTEHVAADADLAGIVIIAPERPDLAFGILLVKLTTWELEAERQAAEDRRPQFRSYMD